MVLRFNSIYHNLILTSCLFVSFNSSSNTITEQSDYHLMEWYSTMLSGVELGLSFNYKG